MRKIAALFLCALFFASALWAHPPEDIIITFDLAKSTVHAVIVHDSKDIMKHFIKQIEVLVNGESMIKQKTITQTGKDGQSVSYVIPGLKKGDKVAIDADCSMYGDLTKEAVADEKPAKKKK